MPSPFPGMNPYLENEYCWHDVHQHFIPHVVSMLVPQVRPNYIVTLDSHIYLHELGAEERKPRPFGKHDLAVSVSVGEHPLPSLPYSASLPCRVTMAVDEEKDTYIQIRDRKTREIVTLIELLSPSNKQRGADREQYLAKRIQYLRSDANFVEIDLLRGGPRMPIEGLSPCDYVVLVSRADRRPEGEQFPIRLRDRLPVIPIPLRPPDPPATLDLQQAINDVYDAAGLEDYIYNDPPRPRLRPEDEAWADALIPRRPA